MGFLQELFNSNEANLGEIHSEGWVLDWVQRAREDFSHFPLAFFSLSSESSSYSFVFTFSPSTALAIHLLSLSLRVTSISLPNLPLQVVASLTSSVLTPTHITTSSSSESEDI